MMKLKIVAFFLLTFLLQNCNEKSQVETDINSIKTSIKNVMDLQVAGWNSGNIPAYMNGYWRSDSLRFASGGNITFGWQNTLDRYQKRYTDKTIMGKLQFSNVNISVINEANALVFGKWELERENDRPWGLFTLHFQKIDGKWLIISDHTSSGS